MRRRVRTTRGLRTSGTLRPTTATSHRKTRLTNRKERTVRISLPHYSGLVEAVHNGFKFTFLDDDNKGMHTPACCKDYFQDLFWVEHMKKELGEVYGFE